MDHLKMYFPLKNGDIPTSHLSFTKVYTESGKDVFFKYTPED